MSEEGDRIKKRVMQLYALAKVDPDEKDEARLNEARSAAFLCLKYARENGVKIKFEYTREVPSSGFRRNVPPPPPPPDDPLQWKPRTSATPVTDFDEFIRTVFGIYGSGAVNSPGKNRGNVNPSVGNPDWFARERHRNAQSSLQDELEKEQAFPGQKNEKGDPSEVINFESKYLGTCKRCGREYNAGERIWWRLGRGATHQACGPQALQDDVA